MVASLPLEGVKLGPEPGPESAARASGKGWGGAASSDQALSEGHHECEVYKPAPARSAITAYTRPHAQHNAVSYTERSQLRPRPPTKSRPGTSIANRMEAHTTRVPSYTIRWDAGFDRDLCEWAVRPPSPPRPPPKKPPVGAKAVISAAREQVAAEAEAARHLSQSVAAALSGLDLKSPSIVQTLAPRGRVMEVKLDESGYTNEVPRGATERLEKSGRAATIGESKEQPHLISALLARDYERVTRMIRNLAPGANK